MNFRLLQSFDNYIDAHLIKGRLEEEGIDCWLKDENMATIYPVLTNAIGGIKLMVPEDQVERAVQLLHSFQEERQKSFSCPYCGSHTIEVVSSPRNPLNWISSISTWLLGSYAIAAEKVWRCFNCGKEFKEPIEKMGE